MGLFIHEIGYAFLFELDFFRMKHLFYCMFYWAYQVYGQPQMQYVAATTGMVAQPAQSAQQPASSTQPAQQQMMYAQYQQFVPLNQQSAPNQYQN